MTNLDKLRIEVGIMSVKQAKECLTDTGSRSVVSAIDHFQQALIETNSLEATRLSLESIRHSVGVGHPKFQIVNILYQNVK